ncbi:MAG: DUF4315 family protein [Oscillospiraceae bacterium]|jgi:hypothetical protein|nr:DUF4315 family protein [Oscillospiraceae bacterium]
MNSKIGRLKDELSRAKERLTECQARVREIERQIIEQENLEILRAVRNAVTSPEELRGLLERIQAAGPQEAPPEAPYEEKEEQQW